MSRCFDVTCDYKEFSSPSYPFHHMTPHWKIQIGHPLEQSTVIPFITGDRHQLTYNLSQNL